MPIDTVSLDRENGEIQLMYQGKTVTPVSATVELNHPRQNGEKVIAQSNVSPNMLRSHPDAVFEEFDVVFALDTNTKIVKGRKISVTGVVLAQLLHAKSGYHPLLKFAAIHCLEFWDAKDFPERIGWAEAILGIKNNPSFNDSTRLGIIVDAHLDDLKKINGRQEPVYGDIYLPQNARLLYASADKKNDSAANMLMTLADKKAKVLLQDIINENPQQNLLVAENKPFSRFRFWNIESQQNDVPGT